MGRRLTLPMDCNHLHREHGHHRRALMSGHSRQVYKFTAYSGCYKFKKTKYFGPGRGLYRENRISYRV